MSFEGTQIYYPGCSGTLCNVCEKQGDAVLLFWRTGKRRSFPVSLIKAVIDWSLKSGGSWGWLKWEGNSWAKRREQFFLLHENLWGAVMIYTSWIGSLYQVVHNIFQLYTLKGNFYSGIILAYKHISKKNSQLKLNGKKSGQSEQLYHHWNIFPPLQCLLQNISLLWLSARSWQGLHRGNGSGVLGLPSSEVWVMKQIPPKGELALPLGTCWLCSTLLHLPAPC